MLYYFIRGYRESVAGGSVPVMDSSGGCCKLAIALLEVFPLVEKTGPYVLFLLVLRSTDVAHALTAGCDRALEHFIYSADVCLLCKHPSPRDGLIN